MPLAHRFLGLALIAGACTDPKTELVLSVQTDLFIPQEADTVTIGLEGPNASNSVEAPLSSASTFPLTLGLVPKDADGALEPVTIQASATLATAEVTSTKVKTGFVRGAIRRLEIFLLKRCGDECTGDERCDPSGCLPPDVSEEDLPGWTLDAGSDLCAFDGGGHDLNGNGRTDECEGLGDLDCDGDLDADDEAAFFVALGSPDDYAAQYPDCDIQRANINGDEYIDGADLEPLEELIPG